MSKFGLEPESGSNDDPSVSERLAAFPRVQPRVKLDLAAVDAAAAPHGFVSREALPAISQPSVAQGRRRRLGTPEPTRHLAIRLTVRQYDRFVAYADQHQLTYHDALAQLLDEASC